MNHFLQTQVPGVGKAWADLVFSGRREALRTTAGEGIAAGGKAAGYSREESTGSYDLDIEPDDICEEDSVTVVWEIA